MVQVPRRRRGPKYLSGNKINLRIPWDLAGALRMHPEIDIKAVVIDHHIVFLGSHNLTHSAMKYNQEMSLMLNDTGIADQIIKRISRFPKTPFRSVK